MLTICKDFLQIVRIFCHDLTDMSCPKLTPLVCVCVVCVCSGGDGGVYMCHVYKAACTVGCLHVLHNTL